MIAGAPVALASIPNARIGEPVENEAGCRPLYGSMLMPPAKGFAFASAARFVYGSTSAPTNGASNDSDNGAFV